MDEEIEKTMRSLDGIESAGAGDDFAPAVMRRLSFVPKQDQWLPWLRYGVAAMIILGALNTLVLFTSTSSTTGSDLSTEIAEEFYNPAPYFFESIDE